MNYTELLDYLNAEGVSIESSFTTNIDQYIENAELKMQRDLRLDDLRFEDTIAVTGGSNTAAITGRTAQQYTATRFVRVENGAFLDQKDETFLDDYDPTRAATGTPRYYAITSAGNIRLTPAPATTTNILWNYKAYIDRLSISITENWLSKYVPDLYRAAIMVEVGIFNKLDEADIKPFFDEYTYRLRQSKETLLIANRSDEYRRATPTPLRGGAAE